MKLRPLLAALAVSSALAAPVHAKDAPHAKNPPPAEKPVHASPTPPAQPTRGPGGSEVIYKDIVATPYANPHARFWIFEPAHAGDKPLPVIAFAHGSGMDSPEAYGSWIGHLVRRGNIVIYPMWQFTVKRASENALLNTAIAIKAALRELKQPGHAQPDLGHFALIGHMSGGIVAANLAAAESGRKLPNVSALMLVDPGNSLGSPEPTRMLPYGSLGNIPPNTLMLVVVGDEDHLIGDADARRIFTAAGAAPANKNYVIVHSDRYGRPPLVADQLSAQAPGEPWNSPTLDANAARRVNAVDYYGYWKLFDALTDAAFFNRNRDIALGDTPAQRDMGKWSDGQPVMPMTVLTSLPEKSQQNVADLQHH